MKTLLTSLLLCVLSASLDLQAQSFNYSDFTSTAGLALNGSAAQGSPVPPETSTVLRLMDGFGSNGQASSAWFHQIVPVAGGFSVNFTFNINSCRGAACADGFAFVVQNSAAATAALGGFGGYLGYAYDDLHNLPGIEDSLAIEFDDFQNHDFNDPNAHHMAAQSCGTEQNTANHLRCNLSLANISFDLQTNASHRVEIAYVPGSLYTTIDNRLLMTTPVDLSALLSLNSGAAYIGFTSGSGSWGENADILNWSYSTRYNAFGTVTSSSNPSDLGQPVTFTATLKARFPGISTPTGQVRFLDGSTLLATETLSAGQATFTTSDLIAGSHNIKVAYSGDTIFNPSSLVPLTQVVQ
ncbi:MAG TPA: Ig-like domain repeat protein [Terriglobales bacterium]